MGGLTFVFFYFSDFEKFFDFTFETGQRTRNTIGRKDNPHSEEIEAKF